MKDLCQHLEETLLESGIEAVTSDAELSEHVGSCDTCQGLLQAWQETEDLLPLSDTVPADWNDRLLARVSGPKKMNRNQRVASAIAATLVFGSILGLVSQLGPRFESSRAPESIDYFAGKKDQVTVPASAGRESQVEAYKVKSPKPLFNESRPAEAVEPEPEGLGAISDAPVFQDSRAPERNAPAVVLAAPMPDVGFEEIVVEDRARQRYRNPGADADASVSRPFDPADFTDSMDLSNPSRPEAMERELDRIEVTGSRIKRADVESASPAFTMERKPMPAAPPAKPSPGTYDDLFEHKQTRGVLADDGAAGGDELRQRRNSDLGAMKEKAESQFQARAGFSISQDILEEAVVSDDEEDLDLLQYQSAIGYWSNPYIPGDPEIRLAQLKLEQEFPEVAAIVSQIQSTRQPVDPPTDEALALSVLADAAAVAEPTRMHVQVNLRAAEQSAGRRPDVDLVTVLHSRTPGSYDAQQHALLDALRQQRQTGDSFTVIASGVVDAILEPDSLRYGPVEEFKQEIASAPSNSGNGKSFAVAMDEAASRLRGDENQALGSRHVIAVIDADPEDRSAAEAAVHRLARDGITLSIVSLSDSVSIDTVRGLALAGSGRYRVLRDPSSAEDILETELAASARAVARAVRLSIRLHDSVRLVDILGSDPLDVVQSQRVRDNERAVDQRVARSMGIAADRGDDEDGIQIVVPAIFSGDDVSIILDVVARQAGPIADVTVRYKDLVQLNNGEARAQLALPRYGSPNGPIQSAVANSALMQEVSQALTEAARAVNESNISEAQRLLYTVQMTLARAAATARDSAALQRDAALIRQLREQLSTVPHQSMSQALEVAAWRKRHRHADSLSTPP